jgi:DNA-binding transcriptional LysR family regulator
MNLRQLTLFQEAYQDLNFTRTARRLYMTQPAVSHAILELESETGTALFERSGRKLRPTEAGRRLHALSSQILALCREASQLASEEERFPVRIGSCITAANFLLPSLLPRWKARHPDTPLTLTVDRASAIETKLEEGQIDLAFLEGIPRSPVWLRTPACHFPMTGICQSGHPFAGKNDIPPEALIHEPLLLREKGSAIREALDVALGSFQLTVSPLMESVNSQAIIQCVRAGLGVSILPECLVASQLDRQDLAAFSLKGIRLSNGCDLCRHPDKALTAPMSDLYELLAEAPASTYKK